MIIISPRFWLKFLTPPANDQETCAFALEWTPTVAIVMIVCNILAIAFAKFTIKKPSAFPALPASSPLGGFGLPALIGATRFGHILGAGAILALTS
ncbi:photosystem I reaction center subunit PsaK [Phormidesmis priestleyi ULC007]|uniref:Photosystem I reaction center subunit PsaK n=1 Tax=Phormidesmis priestleyi ULC007 TaxID=1920490 RepID=A0A2T1DL90_9CYAN|nr:photosystem I reaction center subunit PsaK [Phormidesmis priestleyi]PSB21268.1 photosystem I reaction center subunit PsaK [Phormidesmis priestleyi ULC007]PZO50639.1 MAG: photosystem I reaction center subunit PsaK [Phormidesmis priestleyi]